MSEAEPAEDAGLLGEREGVLSFQRATMLRTEASGYLGEVRSGRRKADAGVAEVAVCVSVRVLKVRLGSEVNVRLGSEVNVRLGSVVE